ncbi:MAG TPA: 2-oxoacid:acceptor oxidoreductase family protein [Acidobacteriaceae bacterium]|jgi:2-oxoisovalerate ferredoxin oxidoreductase beta subunit|nr:2-oxoacid:acceptor oxidoreductase family protein [Acidobacteriaceae bacterium]
MPAEPQSEFVIAQSKPESFYSTYERKEELQNQTHYCPGCGHGIVHKMLAQAIDDLGIQNRTVLISPVGCSVFAYYYFDVGNIQGAHGRAPAVATAVRRSRPDSIVISYQGDGDLSAIGSAEILHAANRGENITVLFVNNAIYSMTGGQVAPTTLLGQKSTTTPAGRSAATEGYPLHMSELLATLEAPVYIERVGLGDNRQIAQAARAVRKALDNQVRGLGFSLVEILSPCPTIWKMSPVEAQRWVKDVMEKTFPLAVLKDRTQKAEPRPAPAAPPPLEKIPSILGIVAEDAAKSTRQEREAASEINLQVRVAGFGGQGVLLLGEVLAEAGLDAGLEVSWLPSYGPEMRSGTSNCHVRLAPDPIDSPLVTHPDVLVAMNEPSLEKFHAAPRPGGWILYNGDKVPENCQRSDAHILARSFLHEAEELGDARVANMVMLGTLLELAPALPESSVEAALQRLVKSPRWLQLDQRAIERGRAIFHEWLEGNVHDR